jgi:hypothetical protein
MGNEHELVEREKVRRTCDVKDCQCVARAIKSDTYLKLCSFHFNLYKLDGPETFFEKCILKPDACQPVPADFLGEPLEVQA